MDEIKLIDIFEKIKNTLLSLKPDLEKKFEEEKNLTFHDKDLLFFQSKLLAVSLNINDSLSSGVRNIRKIISDYKSKSEEKKYFASGEDFKVSEENVNYYSSASSDNTIHEDIITSLQKFEEINNEYSGIDNFIEKSPSVYDVLSFFSKEIPLLKGIKAYKFLKAIYYPFIVPDKPRIEFFYRLSFLETTKFSLKLVKDQYQIVDQVSRLTGENIFNIDTIFGLFTGAEKIKGLTPICTAKPLCEKCQITNYCSYFKFNKKADKSETKRNTIKDWDEEDRPREKLERIGADKLSDSELLSIFIRTGVGSESAVDIGQRLLSTFNDLSGIDSASITELCKIKGIGKAKAIEIKASLEVGKRMVSMPIRKLTQINSSIDIYMQYRMRFVNVKKESFILLLLDTKHRVFKECVVSQGSLSSSIVHPREVFKEAIKESAAAVIFMHNHPSGDPKPSNDDITLTIRLQEVGELVGIKIVDHVIIGDSEYFSFRDEELIK